MQDECVKFLKIKLGYKEMQQQSKNNEQTNTNEHTYNTGRPKNIVTKNETWASVYKPSLSLTLNSASTSLSDNNCLKTLNFKLLKIICKFFKRTYPIFQNKK
jgi:hypothetical protein